MSQGVTDNPPTGKMDRAITTRSRTGCINCRQGRIRCDEKRPDCTNCIAKKRKCSYNPARVPLRDRRAHALPGQQAPWAAQDSHYHHFFSWATEGSSSKKKKVPTNPLMVQSWRLPRSNAIDPFDALPIEMPFKSKELLHYYHDALGAFSGLPKRRINACVEAAVKNPLSLQNTLLIAGVHHVWNVGDLQAFKSAFLFHKLHGIRQVNEWLDKAPDIATFFKCTQLIATLCITECCLRNYVVADAHLTGLVAYMNQFSMKSQGFDPSETVEGELLNRFFILAFNIIHGLKSQRNDFVASMPASTGSETSKEGSKLRAMIYDHHANAAEERLWRLRGVSLFPFFFFSPETVRTPPRHIDMSYMASCVRDVTRMYDMRFERPSGDAATASAYRLWDSGAPSRMFVASIGSHVESLSPPPKRSTANIDPLLSSWSGFHVAQGMYLTTVLGIWNSGSPPETPVHARVLTILKKDLQVDLVRFAKKSEKGQALWLWKLFVGVLSIAHGEAQSSTSQFQELRDYFSHLIRKWVMLTGGEEIEWESARKILGNIAWPAHFQKEDMARQLWNNAILGDD